MFTADIYRSIFDMDEDACLLIKAGVIIDCNQKGLALFGCHLDEIKGKSLHHFSPARQSDGSDSAVFASRKIAQAFDMGTLDFSWQYNNASGEESTIKVLLSPLEINGDQALLARLREYPGNPPREFDTPFHKVGGEQSRKLESLGLMAGGLAHEFNNFLLAIMGNADLLDRDLSAGKPGAELLSEIRKAAGRAADRCNQLLAYAGKGQPHFQLIDLSLTTQEMVQMIKVAISRKIALRLDLTPDLPMIEGDVSQIHQVIMNLVVNASEAIGGKSGVITLSTGLSKCPTQKPDICLLSTEIRETQMAYFEVRDDGEGMDDDIRGRIFDPFFSTKIKGRGLGLASVLGTVRSHQGSLCVRSKPSEGTVIRACFPIADLDHPTVATPSREKVALVGKGTVLIVDDEEYLRVLCSRMLQRMGYTVLLAADGAQALDIYRQKNGRIDGVVLDLVMPAMDGVEVLEKLLEMDPDAKVIMTSGYHEREIATRFSGRGISGFIQKPYVMSDLGKVLGKIIIPREEPDPVD